MAEPVVLLPGFMCDARIFGPQIVALSVDRAVHVASLATGDSIETMAQAVLDDAPPRFALAGHDLGGMVAIEIFRRAPERVLRIALIGTNAQSEMPNVAAAREPQMVRVRAGRLDSVMRDEVLPPQMAAGAPWTEIEDMALAMAMELGEGVFLRQSRALQRRPDQQRSLRQLRVPSLVLCGGEDRLTPPRRHEFIATLIPHARLQVVDGAGHMVSLHGAEACTALMSEWLAAPLTLR